MSNSGLISGVAPGTVAITATTDPSFGSQKTTTTFVVTPATLQSIAITPATVSLASGFSQQLTASGTFSDGSIQDLTQSVTWASSDDNIAIVDPHGRITALNIGTATITATSAGIPVASAAVAITSPTVVSLAITSGDISLAVGQTQAIDIVATLSDNTTQDVTTTAALNVSGGLGSIINGSSPTSRLFSATLVGTGTLTAGMNGKSAQVNVTVGPSQATSISLPPNVSIAAGLSASLQVQAQFTDGSSHLVTTNLSFMSSDPSVVSVDGLGNVTGVSQGSTTITATYNNPSGGVLTTNIIVTVTAATLSSITVTADSTPNAVGIPIQLHAVGNYSDSSMLDITTQVHFTSSDPSVAVVNNLGLVTTVAVGQTEISATLNGVTGSVSLNIGSAIVQAITVSGPNTLAVGATSHLTATGTFSDSSQQEISSLVTWTSSDPVVGVVDASGNAVGVAIGTFNAVATLNGISGSGAIQVTSAAPVTLTSITVTPSSVVLTNGLLNLLGVTTQFTATGNYSDGSTLDLTSTVQWSTSNGSVATINSQGQMQFTLAGLLGLVGLGPTVITVNATSGAVTGTAQVTLTVL